MADYATLAGLATDAILLQRLAMAVTVEADLILEEPLGTPDYAPRRNWAVVALREPQAIAGQMIWMLLARNKAATPAQIQGVTDDALQLIVREAVGRFGRD